MNKKKQLMERDKAFCQASLERGADGWKEFLAKDVIMGTRLHEPYLEGWGKVGSLIAMLYQLPELDFTWEPKHAFVSDDGTLGVTTGIYTRSYLLEGNTETEIGKFCTTWKWIKDNWYVVLDIGN